MHDTHYIAAHHADTPAGAEHLKERFEFVKKKLETTILKISMTCMHVQ